MSLHPTLSLRVYLTDRDVSGDEDRNEPAAAPESTKMTVNQQHLKQAWDTSQVRSREDWLEWIRRLAVEFMKESPSHALRACMSLADVHIPLARELFNAAFVSCWTELFDQYQVSLCLLLVPNVY